MITIFSKRHILKFYLSIAFATLIFITIAIALLFTYNKNSERGLGKPKDKILPILSIGCFALAGYTIYRYLKSAPNITLDKEFVTFNHEIYSTSDIEKIELTGKRPFKYVINFPMEAATLTFKNGETKYIFDDMYSNSWEIKSFLKLVVVEKREFLQIANSTVDLSDVASDHYDTFKGTQITSLRGISLWGLVGFLGYLLLTGKRSNAVGSMIFFWSISALWFIFHTYLMHYFQVSNNYFVVRSHNLFWKKKAYNLSDITEIVFETQGKMPNCLRVITKDFRNKLYPAGTLRDKTWLALKDKLEIYKIKVRNECI